MDTLTAAGGNVNWYRGFIQGKTRVTLAWIFALLLGLSAREYPSWPGVMLCFLGAGIRFWASWYLRKDTRPAVGGPYSFVRNPLYLGTYLMALGTAWTIENWVLLLIVTFVFAGVYHFIILDEEVKLRRMFGEPYSQYCKKVPRFFPRVWPPLFPAQMSSLIEVNPETSNHRFSYSLAMENKAYEAFVTFIALMIFVMGVAYLWKHL